MSHRDEAPSCNGSQQESQKLTGDSARETPSKKPLLERLRTFPKFGTTDGARWYQFDGTEPTCVEAADEIERLRGELNAKSRELEEARKDAARYRWLREHFMYIFCADDDTDGGNFKLNADTVPERLDAAIDSALHHDGK